MGIKNLAYCVADVEVGNSTLQEEAGTNMNVLSWRRLDVVEEVSKSAMKPIAGSDEGVEDPYTPSSLSNTAYTLLVGSLLPYKPDVILIERQRWRSANGAAIQQWTVRVNTLEGMLWAILTALRAEAKVKDARTNNEPRQQHYDVFGIDPKRVSSFWIGEKLRTKASERGEQGGEDGSIAGPEGEVEEAVGKKRSNVKRLSRGKTEKNAKIQLLRLWLTSNIPSTSAFSSGNMKDKLDNENPTINFTFHADAAATRNALRSTEPRRGGRMSRASTLDLKKLDDVTDCFLQATAWIVWEMNRSKVVRGWDSENGRLRGQDTATNEAEEIEPIQRVSKTTKSITRRKRKPKAEAFEMPR